MHSTKSPVVSSKRELARFAPTDLSLEDTYGHRGEEVSLHNEKVSSHHSGDEANPNGFSATDIARLARVNTVSPVVNVYTDNLSGGLDVAGFDKELATICAPRSRSEFSTVNLLRDGSVFEFKGSTTSDYIDREKKARLDCTNAQFGSDFDFLSRVNKNEGTLDDLAHLQSDLDDDSFVYKPGEDVSDALACKRKGTRSRGDWALAEKKARLDVSNCGLHDNKENVSESQPESSTVVVSFSSKAEQEGVEDLTKIVKERNVKTLASRFLGWSNSQLNVLLSPKSSKDDQLASDQTVPDHGVPPMSLAKPSTPAKPVKDDEMLSSGARGIPNAMTSPKSVTPGKDNESAMMEKRMAKQLARKSRIQATITDDDVKQALALASSQAAPTLPVSTVVSDKPTMVESATDQNISPTKEILATTSSAAVEVDLTEEARVLDTLIDFIVQKEEAAAKVTSVEEDVNTPTSAIVLNAEPSIMFKPVIGLKENSANNLEIPATISPATDSEIENMVKDMVEHIAEMNEPSKTFAPLLLSAVPNSKHKSLEMPSSAAVELSSMKKRLDNFTKKEAANNSAPLVSIAAGEPIVQETTAPIGDKAFPGLNVSNVYPATPIKPKMRRVQALLSSTARNSQIDSARKSLDLPTSQSKQSQKSLSPAKDEDFARGVIAPNTISPLVFFNKSFDVTTSPIQTSTQEAKSRQEEQFTPQSGKAEQMANGLDKPVESVSKKLDFNAVEKPTNTSDKSDDKTDDVTPVEINNSEFRNLRSTLTSMLHTTHLVEPLLEPVAAKDDKLISFSLEPKSPFHLAKSDPKYLEVQLNKLFRRRVSIKVGDVSTSQLSVPISFDVLSTALDHVLFEQAAKEASDEQRKAHFSDCVTLAAPDNLKSILVKPDLFEKVPEYFDHAITPCVSPCNMQFDKNVRPDRPSKIARFFKVLKKPIELVFPSKKQKKVHFPTEDELVSKDIEYDDAVNSGQSGFRVLVCVDKESMTMRFPKYKASYPEETTLDC